MKGICSNHDVLFFLNDYFKKNPTPFSYVKDKQYIPVCKNNPKRFQLLLPKFANRTK